MKDKIFYYTSVSLIALTVFFINKSYNYEENLNSIIATLASSIHSNSREISYILEENPDFEVSINDYNIISKNYDALSEKLDLLIIYSKVTPYPYLDFNTNSVLQVLNANIDKSKNLNDIIPAENIYNLKEVYKLNLSVKNTLDQNTDNINIKNLNTLIKNISNNYGEINKEID